VPIRAWGLVRVTVADAHDLGASGGRLNSGRERIALAMLLALADRPPVGERRRPPDIRVQALPRMREDEIPRMEGQGPAAERVRWLGRGLTRAHCAKPSATAAALDTSDTNTVGSPCT
jgi:hypothetical protein